MIDRPLLRQHRGVVDPELPGMSFRLPLGLGIAHGVDPKHTRPVAHGEPPRANASRLVSVHDLVEARVHLHRLPGNTASLCLSGGSRRESFGGAAGSPTTVDGLEGVSYFTGSEGGHVRDRPMRKCCGRSPGAAAFGGWGAPGGRSGPRASGRPFPPSGLGSRSRGPSSMSAHGRHPTRSCRRRPRSTSDPAPALASHRPGATRAISPLSRRRRAWQQGDRRGYSARGASQTRFCRTT